jgi:hypothetical protein
LKVKFVVTDYENMPSMKSKITPDEAVLYDLQTPFTPQKPNSRYWLRCHKCSMVANLGDHDITIQGENITISPSILCPREGCFCRESMKLNQN